MANVTNTGYYGKNGTLDIGADTHLGVTSFALVPTTNVEQVEDISGDVQAFAGTPMWQAQFEFNQDHATTGAITRVSLASAGTVVSLDFTPDDGGDSYAIDAIWIPSQIGGATGRRTATLALPCKGQPVVTPAA